MLSGTKRRIHHRKRLRPCAWPDYSVYMAAIGPMVFTCGMCTCTRGMCAYAALLSTYSGTRARVCTYESSSALCHEHSPSHFKPIGNDRDLTHGHGGTS